MVKALGAGNVIAHDNPFNCGGAGEAGRYFANEKASAPKLNGLSFESLWQELSEAVHRRWSEVFRYDSSDRISEADRVYSKHASLISNLTVAAWYHWIAYGPPAKFAEEVLFDG